MSLEDKSNENLKLVNNYVNNKKNHNIAASRAYYAIYQRIKHYLQKQEKAYISFLQSTNTGIAIKDIYKHSTINMVLIRYAFDKNKGKKIDQRELNQLVIIQTLRQMREKADYEKNDITYPEAYDSLKYANNLTPIIDKYLS